MLGPDYVGKATRYIFNKYYPLCLSLSLSSNQAGRISLDYLHYYEYGEFDICFPKVPCTRNLTRLHNPNGTTMNNGKFGCIKASLLPRQFNLSPSLYYGSFTEEKGEACHLV